MQPHGPPIGARPPIHTAAPRGPSGALMSATATPIRRASSSQAGWHEGERLLQTRAGTAGRLAEVGPLILRDHLPHYPWDEAFQSRLPASLQGVARDHGVADAGARAAGRKRYST